MGERQGDGSVPAPQIEDVTGAGGRAPSIEQQPGARVDRVGREHAAVGRECQRDIRQGQRDSLGCEATSGRAAK